MGKKLNAWIAEEIIGESPYEGPMRMYTKVLGGPLYPHYTSDMNEAVKVLNTLPWGNWLGKFDEGWKVTNHGSDDAPYHENPAMAICLAAYKLETGEDWSDE